MKSKNWVVLALLGVLQGPFSCSYGIYIHDDNNSYDGTNRYLNQYQPFQFSSSAHVCLLAHDMVQCVGYNYYGQLGQSSSEAFGTPVQLNFPSSITAKPIKVVTGYDHTCTLFNDGHVWCNGSNGFQQLGNGGTVNSATPVQVKKNGVVLTNVIDIEAGSYHNCAIQNNGAMYCWGFNVDGQLGMNAIMDGSTSEKKAVKMALSMSATCIITELDATKVYCVGYNYSNNDNGFTIVDLGNTVTMQTDKRCFAAGSHHFCVLLDTAKVKCWGSNHNGQLGIGSAQITAAYHVSPVFVLQDSTGVEVSGITDINAGYASTCLVASGKPMCFGNNQYFQLGIANGGANILYPTLVTPFDSISGKNLVSVHIGEYTGHAVFDDNSLYSVGTNNGGTFGDGSTISIRNIVGDTSGDIASQISFVIGSNTPSLVHSSSPSLQPSLSPSLTPSLTPSTSSSPSISTQPSNTPTVNVARNTAGGVASQSSTGGGFGAGKAIDGNLDINWSKGSSSTYWGDSNPWWQVHFSQSYEIQMIKIYFKSNTGHRLLGSRLTLLHESQEVYESYISTTVTPPNPIILNIQHIVGNQFKIAGALGGGRGKELMFTEVEVYGAQPPSDSQSPSDLPSLSPSSKPSTLFDTCTFLIDASNTNSYIGTGNTVNDLIDGTQGTFIGSTSFEASYVNSFVFNGNTDYIQFGNIGSFASATFTCWVKRNGSDNDHTGLITSRPNSEATEQDVTGIGIMSNGNIWYFWNGIGWLHDSDLSVPVGQWTMITVTMGAGTVKFYRNVATGISHSYNNSPTTMTNLVLGDEIYEYANSERFFNGQIATAAIYNRALSDLEVAQLFNDSKASFGYSIEYSLAFNVNPSDGNDVGYGSSMWDNVSNVGSSTQSLSHDYKSLSIWSQQFQCLTVARHNGSGIIDGLKVWKLNTRDTLSNHFQNEWSRTIMTTGGPVQEIKFSNVNYDEDPILASTGSNNNLAFNWYYGNNGARIVLTDVGHWSGTLSGAGVDDDGCHGIGNDFAFADGGIWRHDASIIQGTCYATSCKILGTDHGGAFPTTSIRPKYGNYAFLIADLDSTGKCPIATTDILLGA